MFRSGDLYTQILSHLNVYAVEVRVGTRIDASHGRTAVGVKPRIERLELRRRDTKLGLDSKAVVPIDSGVDIRTTTWDSDTI